MWRRSRFFLVVVVFSLSTSLAIRSWAGSFTPPNLGHHCDWWSVRHAVGWHGWAACSYQHARRKRPTGVAQLAYLDENIGTDPSTCGAECHFQPVNYRTRNVGGGVQVDLGKFQLTQEHTFSSFNAVAIPHQETSEVFPGGRRHIICESAAHMYTQLYKSARRLSCRQLLSQSRVAEPGFYGSRGLELDGFA